MDGVVPSKGWKGRDVGEVGTVDFDSTVDFLGTVDFDSYVREHTPRLLRLAAVLANDNGVAEDVVQDVLIKAFARWARIGEVDNQHAYLRRMVINEFSSWRRKWARYVPHPDADLDRQISDGTAQFDERLTLLVELAKLPARQRAAVTLRYLEDLSDAQIANVLDCREVTVRGYIHRALKALRVQMIAPPAPPARHHPQPALSRKDA